jgi:parvulin-like peptidyl-prolyl isomerase
MAAVLQIGDKSFTAEQIFPLITRCRLVSQLARELVLTAALQHHEITAAEHLNACKKFYREHQINTEQDLEQWLQQEHLERSDLVDLIDRDLRLHKFKIAQWEHQIASYFCQRKSQIDRVVFSMIRVKELDIAEELYFRLLTKESSFAELAPRYSTGMEAQTKGINGPVELGQIEPALANLLTTSQPAEVQPPLCINDWWLVVQLEVILPVQLNEQIRQRLTEELFTTWLTAEVQKSYQLSAN